MNYATKVLLERLSPEDYLQETLGFTPFEWQREAMDPAWRRVLLNCARQSGKSTGVGGETFHGAKAYPGSLTILESPTERQSKELMIKVMTFAEKDPGVIFVEKNTLEKKLSNGSRIVSLPGSEETIRGYSGPRLILIDEASRVGDPLYHAIRPMMVGADTKLILLSTPFGKQGFYYDEWIKGSSERWKKIMVKAPCDIVDGRLVPPLMTEEEFRDHWAEKGVSAYYSPRHTFEFLEEEFDTMPEYWFRQEYLCEFTESNQAMFRAEDIDAAFIPKNGKMPESIFAEKKTEGPNGKRRTVKAFDWSIN